MNSIVEHKKLLENQEFRKKLLAYFLPTFCFAKDEENFPCKPEDYLRNIIEVKLDEYRHIKVRQGRGLTTDEQKELNIINSYFWKDGKFNDNYLFELKSNPAFKEDLKRVPGFQIFDEKKYGYKTGAKINLKGSRPYNSAPLFASIILQKMVFLYNMSTTMLLVTPFLVLAGYVI